MQKNMNNLLQILKAKLNVANQIADKHKELNLNQEYLCSLKEIVTLKTIIWLIEDDKFFQEEFNIYFRKEGENAR